MSEHEKNIIESAVKNAFDFCGGILTTAQEEIEDYGYTWNEEHEKYAFEYD